MATQAPSFNVTSGKLNEIKDSALLYGFFKDNLNFPQELKDFDSKTGSIISAYIKEAGFKGEKGEARSVFINSNVKNLVLVGLGEEQKYGPDVLSNVIADMSKKLRDNGSETFSIYLPSFANGIMSEKSAIEKSVLSAQMGLYKFIDYKTKDRDKIKYIKQVNLVATEKNYDEALKNSSIIADAVNKTRDIVNTPPNVATPEFVASYAMEISKKAGIKCTVLDDKMIESKKMECLAGVGRGSINKPRLVILEYKGSNKDEKPIAIVGKGVTFDSGGLNVKLYPYILNMKDDKGGAIAAIHIIEACSRLNLPLNVLVVAPLCENMIDASAYRPDDVLKAYNGMTVEIKNTDAEGRLILADALSYTVEMKPQAIIDIASLTGASAVVLGSIGTPYLSSDDKLSEKLETASKNSLEKVWKLPLWQEYEESMKSDIADIKNISEDGDAGVIMGATFLKNFVSDIPWLHIDIGTTVWSKNDKGVLVKGATGATVRLMMSLLMDWKK